ncbi:unnamed protein product [Miscanthus lutarioriparius]|uniref:Uncharacterized protein n=1 Tax=Miscanthus lutarioriparius TaxID=422564 RepID=A0A811RBR8_9POAL|nr:unnamed protein product [Miscanthus lutarioriparius]
MATGSAVPAPAPPACSPAAVFFSFLVVRQRLTVASVNAIALLTVGAVVLGLHVLSDRPLVYCLGFTLTLGAAALYGLVLPLVELAYKRAVGGGRSVSYALVVEMQLVMGFFATAFCTVGMPARPHALRLRLRSHTLRPARPPVCARPRCAHSPVLRSHAPFSSSATARPQRRGPWRTGSSRERMQRAGATAVRAAGYSRPSRGEPRRGRPIGVPSAGTGCGHAAARVRG